MQAQRFWIERAFQMPKVMSGCAISSSSMAVLGIVTLALVMMATQFMLEGLV